jgi:hypothetical protein
MLKVDLYHCSTLDRIKLSRANRVPQLLDYTFGAKMAFIAVPGVWLIDVRGESRARIVHGSKATESRAWAKARWSAVAKTGRNCGNAPTAI